MTKLYEHKIEAVQTEPDPKCFTLELTLKVTGHGRRVIVLVSGASDGGKSIKVSIELCFTLNKEGWQQGEREREREDKIVGRVKLRGAYRFSH